MKKLIIIFILLFNFSTLSNSYQFGTRPFGQTPFSGLGPFGRTPFATGTGSSGGGGSLLLESSGYLLLESGGKIKL